MGYNFNHKCQRCGASEVEQIDDWISTQCPRCNDRDIDHANERAEFRAFHPEGK